MEVGSRNPDTLAAPRVQTPPTHPVQDARVIRKREGAIGGDDDGDRGGGRLRRSGGLEGVGEDWAAGLARLAGLAGLAGVDEIGNVRPPPPTAIPM